MEKGNGEQYLLSCKLFYFLFIMLSVLYVHPHYTPKYVQRVSLLIK